MSVDIAGKTAWTGAIAGNTPSSTGTTASGEGYAVYPLSVTVPHSLAQLNVGVTSNLPLGSGRAFAVDNVRASLSLVAPQSFDVALPLSVSDGVPAAGAGKLETIGSEDHYLFSMATAGGLQLDFSSCSSSLYLSGVDWKLVAVGSGATIASAASCGSKLVPNVPAGDYRLEVSRNGSSGTYKVGVLVQPAPDVFNVSLPASVSNGVPATGAGNLETTASEDRYLFSTSSAGGVQLDFSSCSSSLYLSRVDWKLVAVGSGATIASAAASCWSKLVPNVPAGDYRLEVSRNGSSGTYKVGVRSG